MNNFDPHRYTITIKRVTLEEGEYFEATVAELPDLVEYGETYDQAYSLAVDAIEALNEAALEQGRAFPEPMPSRALEEFSGRITLRMSKALHASVSKLANRDGVSINLWIVEAVTARAGAGFSALSVERACRAEVNRLFVSFSKVSGGRTLASDLKDLKSIEPKVLAGNEVMDLGWSFGRYISTAPIASHMYMQ